MKEKIILHVTKLLQQQKRWKRWQKAVTAMAAVVVFCTVYALILPAVTMGAKTFCGMEEHVHTDECYLLRRIGASTPSDAERWDIDDKLGTPSNAELEDRLEELREFYLTEGGKGTASNADRATASDAMEYEWDENDKYKYDTSLIGDDSFLLDDYLPYTEGMEYDEENYELIRICEMEEHTHSLICYSDPEADLEDETIWTQTIPELSGNIPEDLIRVAQSQMNYRESEKNYQVEGVDEIKGYSRYGQWYGEPYGDWGTMFASFCMNYAGVENAPVTADFDGLMESMKGGVPELYREKDYIPKPGDLVFAAGAAGQPGRVGVITDVELDDEGNVSRFTAIEGDYENQVAARTHRGGEEDIRGFAALSKFGPDEEIVIITLTAETENTVVTATFEKSTLPENVKMEAEEISKDDPQVVEMREKLAEQGKSQGKVLTAMVPMNITFLDEEGKTVEPQGPVQYSVEFKTPVKNVDESLAEDETEKDGGSDSEDQISAKTEAAQPEDEGTSEILEVSRAQRSDRVRVRVGTAIDRASETDRKDEEAGTLTGQETGTVSGDGQENGNKEASSWQLFRQSADGALENRSSDEKTELKAEDGALLGAAFEIQGNQNEEGQPSSENSQKDVQNGENGSLNMYLVAYSDEPETSVSVKDFVNLKKALTSQTVINIILENDIQRPSDADVTIGLPVNANKVLNLNGYVLSLEGTTKTFVDVNNGSHLTIKDEIIGGGRETKIDRIDPEELDSLWYDDRSSTEAVTNNRKAETVGYGSSYDPGTNTLTFFVTETEITDKNVGATKETLVGYKVTGSGVIKGSDNAEHSVFYIDNGTLTLEGGMIAGSSNRAINSYNNGIINLNGGYICGNSSSDKGGAIWLQRNTVINLNGGYICGNSSSNNGGAIWLEGNAVVNMPKREVSTDPLEPKPQGTCISGNSAVNGGAVYATGDSSFNMSGGYITNNSTTGSGGGIYADGGDAARVNLQGGYITNNKAKSSGGGVYKSGACLLSMKTLDEKESGCFVTRNLAIEGEGGGITIGGGKGEILKGYFTNNRTDTHHHWGGGGLFISDGSQAYVENTLVTNNTAGGFGGGVTGCPTSRIYITTIEDGMAIYDNHAGEAGEPDSAERAKLGWHLSGSQSGKPQDHKFMYQYEKFLDNGYSDFFCALTCMVDVKMLGDVYAHWTGIADTNVVDNPQEGPLQCAGVMGLVSHLSEAEKAKTWEEARLFFNGNSSWTHAGGILCNGYMVVGNVTEISVVDRMILKGTKSLIDDFGERLPMEKGQFQFGLYNSAHALIYTFENNENGEINFNVRLPGMAGDSSDFWLEGSAEGTSTYYLAEIAGNGLGEILTDSTIYKIQMTVKREQKNDMQFPAGEDTKTIRKYLYTITNATVQKRTDGNMEASEGWVGVQEARFEINNDEQGSDTLYLTEFKPTFINRKKTNMKVTVHKRWGKDGEEYKGPTPSIKVNLLKNGTKIEEVELDASKGWSHTWENLSVREENGTLNRYTVEEAIPDGFQPIYSPAVSSTDGYWVPATSLEAGHQYVIVNQNGDKVLAVSDGHANNMFTGDDTRDGISKGNGSISVGGKEYTDWYPGDMFRDRSVFSAQHPKPNGSNDGKNDLVLVTNGLDSSTKKAWLLLEAGGFQNATDDKGLKLKSTASTDNASAFWIGENSSLRGRYRYWHKRDDGHGVPYYVTFDGTQFNSKPESEGFDTSAAKVYTLVLNEKNPEITITNVPNAKAKFTLEVRKVSKANTEVNVSGAQFQLKKASDNVLLKFKKDEETGAYVYYLGEETENVSTDFATNSEGLFVLKDLPIGTYILVETQAPTGYSKIEDQTITINASEATGDRIKYTIEEPSYTLPETGGNGENWYALGGMLFMMAGGLVYGYSSRRRRERRFR